MLQAPTPQLKAETTIRQVPLAKFLCEMPPLARYNFSTM